MCAAAYPTPPPPRTSAPAAAAPLHLSLRHTSCQLEVPAEKLGGVVPRSDDGRSGLALELCFVRSKVWNQVCQLPYRSLLRHRGGRQTSHEVRLHMLLLHISCRAKKPKYELPCVIPCILLLRVLLTVQLNCICCSSDTM